jgi:hypothetical protein
MSPCATCAASNPLVLVRHNSPPACYRCHVRPHESHHPRGGQAGVSVPGLDANEHRVISEAERIGISAGCLQLCPDCGFRFGAFVGVRLCSLGILGG